MPHWEDELKSLLDTLGVSLESAAAAEPDCEGAGATMQPAHQQHLTASEAEAMQRDLVKREMQATIHEVTRLTRAGYIDSTLHDDIMRVLQALMRPAPLTPNLPAREEWQLTSSAAILRFCRVVLRLTRPLSSHD